MTLTEELLTLRRLKKQRQLTAHLQRLRLPSLLCPHIPTARQMEFLTSQSLEVLYGGAAGGGKSDAILMAALQYSDVPNYAALILRQTYTDLSLPGALIDRSHEWFHGHARWSAQEHTWTFEGGGKLAFGYLDSPRARYRYQSSEFQFIGFDELTQFKESDYRYLFSRLRRTASSDVPLRMRSASNPGGVGHDWVRRRFMVDRNDARRFIPATLRENPYVDREAYLQSLAQLDPLTREQLLDGNWDAGDDALIAYDWILRAEVANMPPLPVRPELYIGVDVGRSRDRTCVWTWEKLGDVCWCRECLVLDKTPFEQQAAAIRSRITPGVVRVQIDRGFNPQLAEDLTRKYPSTVTGIQLTQGRLGQFASQLANAFEANRVRIPEGDDDLRADLRLVRRVGTSGTTAIVATDRDATGHADRFWAAALGYDAAHWNVQQRTATLPGAYRRGVTR